jgi:hypothetical protein
MQLFLCRFRGDIHGCNNSASTVSIDVVSVPLFAHKIIQELLLEALLLLLGSHPCILLHISMYIPELLFQFIIFIFTTI